MIWIKIRVAFTPYSHLSFILKRFEKCCIRNERWIQQADYASVKNFTASLKEKSELTVLK